MSLQNKLTRYTGKTTEYQYNFLWKKFCTFLESKSWLKDLNVRYVYEYFSYLIDCGYNYNSLLCVRSALTKPLKYLLNFDFLNDPYMESIFTFAKVNCKKRDSYFPSWSLDKVMGMFESDTYKSLCLRNLEYSLLKDFFLVLMACPKRISEFHLLSISEIVYHNDGSVTLKPTKDFVKKNHTASFKPVDISIKPLLCKPVLCPVKALNHYLFFTKKLCIQHKRQRPDNLWINKNLKPASKANLRNWLRRVVLEADPTACKQNIKFHSTRGVAASVLYKNFDIHTVLSQMQWKSSSTFFKYYYRPDLQANSIMSIAGLNVNV